MRGTCASWATTTTPSLWWVDLTSGSLEPAAAQRGVLAPADPRLRQLRNRETFEIRGGDERAVAGDQDDIGIAHHERSREVHRVVPAQRVILGLLARQMGERVVHLSEPGVELVDRTAKIPSAHSVKSLGVDERGTGFRVDEPDAHDSISGVP